MASNWEEGAGPLLVTVLGATDNKDLSKKLQIYLQSTKSGEKKGECQVERQHGNSYRVTFTNRADKDTLINKKDHSLEKLENRSLPLHIIEEQIKYNTEHGNISPGTSPTPRPNAPCLKEEESSSEIVSSGQGDESHPGHPKSSFGAMPIKKASPFVGNVNTEPNPVDMETDITSSNPGNVIDPILRSKQAEVFSKVSATLFPGLISREEIKKLFPSLKVSRKSTDGIIEVTGSFPQIEQVFGHLKLRFKGPNTSEERSFLHNEWEHQIEMTDSKENSSLLSDEEGSVSREEDSIPVQVALYQYFTDVYPAVIHKINNQYNVHLTNSQISEDSTSINFISMGSRSCKDKAKALFIDTVQKITSDWTQAIVNVPEKGPSDIKTKMRKICSKVLVIVEGDKIILRGPRDEISRAKSLIENGELYDQFDSPVSHILITNHGMGNKLTLDERHLDILKKLKSKEIKEMEEKYGVIFNESKDGKKNVNVMFTTSHGEFDLSPHACQTFLNLLHKTLTNIATRDITMKPWFTDAQFVSFQERLQNLEIVSESSGGSLVLIGSLGNILTAEKILGKMFVTVPGAVGGEEEAMETDQSSSTEVKRKPEEEEEDCPICLEKPQNKTVLDKCKHAFCDECLKKAMAVKPVCPTCNLVYSQITGDQPDGHMSDQTIPTHLPGYKCNTIVINYRFPNGTQAKNHPHPGTPYSGTSRTAYLPNNKEGQEVLRLLRRAFNQKLIFTIGRSRTTGAENTVTWNDIHHKTSMFSGNFGYPDPDYLKRVRDELKAKGIE